MAVRQVPTRPADRLRQKDVRGQFAAPTPEVAESAADVRALDTAGEEPARLHPPGAGVVDRGRGVGDAPAEAGLVRRLCHLPEDLADLHPGNGRLDGLGRAANFFGRLRLHVPRIELA